MIASTSSNSPLLFGRGGYNGPAKDEEEDSRSLSNFGRGGYNAPNPSTLVNSGRGGYNRGDDDEEEDGRGGYN
jgi:hypothetical protein